MADVYRENWTQQKQLVEISGDKSENNSISESKQNFIAERSLAREILTEIEVARCKEEFADFMKNKDFQKFEVTDRKTGEAEFVSLSEVRFDSRGSLFDQTLEYFLENREKRRTRNAVESLVKEKGTELKENLKSAKDLLKVSGEIAGDFKTKSFFGATRYLHTPLFTPKELITIELRINQTESKSEAAKLQKIPGSVDRSKSKNLSEILREFAPEKEDTKTVERTFKVEQNLTAETVKDEANTKITVARIRENKPEILTQEKGR